MIYHSFLIQHFNFSGITLKLNMRIGVSPPPQSGQQKRNKKTNNYFDPAKHIATELKSGPKVWRVSAYIHKFSTNRAVWL